MTRAQRRPFQAHPSAADWWRLRRKETAGTAPLEIHSNHSGRERYSDVRPHAGNTQANWNRHPGRPPTRDQSAKSRRAPARETRLPFAASDTSLTQGWSHPPALRPGDLAAEGDASWTSARRLSEQAESAMHYGFTAGTAGGFTGAATGFTGVMGLGASVAGLAGAAAGAVLSYSSMMSLVMSTVLDA